jgi:hypothetical protein
MSYEANALRPAQGSDAPGGAPPERTSMLDRARGESRADGRDLQHPVPQRPKGAPYREHADWGQVAAFAAGIAVGALLGAGAALLAAPQSGMETRLALKRGARKARVRAEDRWDDLGRELRAATRRGRRNVRRKVAESRWRAADAFES